MRIEKAIELIDAEWDPDHGSLGRLRSGIFDSERLKGLEDILRSLSFRDDEHIPRRLVALVWHIPTFMTYQSPSIKVLSETFSRTNLFTVVYYLVDKWMQHRYGDSHGPRKRRRPRADEFTDSEVLTLLVQERCHVQWDICFHYFYLRLSVFICGFKS